VTKPNAGYPETTHLYTQILQAIADNARLIILQGGTSSSKTISVLQVLMTLLAADFLTKPKLASIVSESVPHLKRGALRDAKNILGPAWSDDLFHSTDRVYKFQNNKGVMEFFPADDSTKLRGGRRDILFVNEANNISKASFDELDVRTSWFSIIDFNPVSEFWAHSLIGQPGVVFIKSTYLDAKSVLPPSVVSSIESRRDKDPNWWRVYGLGEIGSMEGLVHPLFDQVPDMPNPAGCVEFYGLDFGFGQDPAALTRHLVKGDDLYSDQLIHETGLTNQNLSKRFEALGLRKGYDEIYADAAEPKSIEELRVEGWNIKAAPKGPDSIRAGYQRVNQFRQHWTSRSIDAIKEQRNYRFIETSDGKLTPKPIDDYNHQMDSRRYAVFGKYHDIDVLKTSSLFHHTPNTDKWQLTVTEKAISESLFGFAYDKNRIYGVSICHNVLNDAIFIRDCKEFSTMSPLNEWMQSWGPRFRCFADIDMQSDTYKSVSEAFRISCKATLNYSKATDDPGIALYANRLLNANLLYVIPDSVAHNLIKTSIDTSNPYILALFSVLSMTAKKKAPAITQERSVFHRKREMERAGAELPNGFMK
jgi:phage terminase large subunit